MNDEMKTRAKTRGARRPDAADEAPPLGRSWAALYAAVLGFLALLVVLFYLFTRAFR